MRFELLFSITFIAQINTIFIDDYILKQWGKKFNMYFCFSEKKFGLSQF
jgi:hypothetical protein